MLSPTAIKEDEVRSFFTTAYAATLAVIPVFPDLIAKSAEQKGEMAPKTSFLNNLKSSVKAAPSVGIALAGQMALLKIVKNTFYGDENKEDLVPTLVSSGVVGVLSAAPLAVLNGQTMGLSVRTSLQKFSIKQGLAITFRETAFVAGLSMANPVSTFMKKNCGDSKLVDYTTAFFAGALGSLAGHPADTLLTRSQSGLKTHSFREFMGGTLRKTRALGLFSLFYQIGKDTLA